MKHAQVLPDQKLFIETAKDRRCEDGRCSIADVRPATSEEVEKFKSEPCDHTREELLIYDVVSFAWDIRHCAVCHSVIGLI